MGISVGVRENSAHIYQIPRPNRVRRLRVASLHASLGSIYFAFALTVRGIFHLTAPSAFLFTEARRRRTHTTARLSHGPQCRHSRGFRPRYDASATQGHPCAHACWSIVAHASLCFSCARFAAKSAQRRLQNFVFQEQQKRIINTAVQRLSDVCIHVCVVRMRACDGHLPIRRAP